MLVYFKQSKSSDTLFCILYLHACSMLTVVSAMTFYLFSRILKTHRAPPQSISIGGKLLVALVLHKVDQE